MPKQTYEAPDNATAWERQTGESDPAFAAFLHYKSLPPVERSLSRVASDVGKSISLIKRWSSANGWQDRITAYTIELEREKEKGAREEARKMGERQATHLAAMSRVLIAPVQELYSRLVDKRGDFSDLSERELYNLSVLAARAYPALARAERLVRGQPTEITSTPTDADGVSIVEGQVVMGDQAVADFWGAVQQAGITLDQLGIDTGVLPDDHQ